MTNSKSRLSIFKKKHIGVVKDKNIIHSASAYKQLLPRRDSLSNKQDSSGAISTSDSTHTHVLKELKEKIYKPALNTSGNISVGYDYGVIPFAANASIPTGYYSAEGNTNLPLFSLPINVSFYYSNLKNISGLNNYFRVSFDARQYKEDRIAKASGLVREERKKLDQLYTKVQLLSQKIDYLKSIESSKKWSGYPNKPTIPSYTIPTIPTTGLDTSWMPFKHPSINKQNIPSLSDSLLNPDKQPIADLRATYNTPYKNKEADSIKGKLEEYKNELTKCKSEINKANELINAYKNPDQVARKYNPYAKTADAWLASIKKFEIGLCYPNYSTFLINGATIRGINIEIEKQKFYLAFTHGKTINNLLHSNNQVQNTLQHVKNLYNFFDFNNVLDSRQITAVKFGIGKMEETHLHFGLLYGYGLTSYLKISPNPAEHEKNYVGEMDAKWCIGDNNTLDIVYGKSSLQVDKIIVPQQEKGFSALIAKKERSNAAMARYTSLISKTHTRLFFTGRLIDPFFNSYGVGYIRSDNFRYEVKAEQQISARIKITASYRKDKDNLLNLCYYTNTLQTIGAAITAKLTKRITVRAGYNPVLQTMHTTDNHTIINHNNISHAMFTYIPKIKHLHTSFNILYCYYNLSNDSISNLFQNFTFNNITSFTIPIQNTASFSRFVSNTIDSLSTNTSLMSDELSYTFKNNISVSAGLKYAIGKSSSDQIGYNIKASIPFVKYLSAEMDFEKLVLGDFYNSYNVDQIKKFPYFADLKLIYTW